MARTTGPLLSMDASGSVGEALTFSKWKGRNYVRRWAVPHNPKSTGQVTIRAAMQLYAALYQTQTSTVISAFEAYAQSAKISPYNAFVQAGVKAWKSAIIVMPDGTEESTLTGTSAPTVTAAAQARGIVWSWTASGAGTDIGYVLSIRQGADPAYWAGYAVYGTAIGTNFIQTGLPAATAYTARVVAIQSDGTLRQSAGTTESTL